MGNRRRPGRDVDGFRGDRRSRREKSEIAVGSTPSVRRSPEPLCGCRWCAPEASRSPSLHQITVSAPMGSTMSTVKPGQVPRARRSPDARAGRRARPPGPARAAGEGVAATAAAGARRRRNRPGAVRLEPALDEVHRRRADEAGDEQVGRAVVDRRPASPSCWIMPPFMTAMRSASVIASIWSWVT